MTYTPATGDRFNAYIRKTKAEGGTSVNIKTRNCPYTCTKRQMMNKFTTGIIAKDDDNVKFVFHLAVFRFEKI